MRLPIESWLVEISLPEESRVAFNESVVAFKAGANRAALLFAYVGWGLALRDRLLNTPGPPNGMQQGQWDNIMRSLRDEDHWDAQVFDCTQMHNAVVLFQVSEDIRHQVRYWKDRRNDCAHFKLNEISAAHVDAFWAFVRSNLGRFVPLGSEEALIAAIIRHFDANLTPPGTDLMPLVSRIPDSMSPDRFKPFLTATKNSLTTTLGKLVFPRVEDVCILLASCVAVGGRLGTAALELLMDDRMVLVAVLRKWPESVGYLSAYPAQIRLLWHSDLFQQNHKDLNIYAALLRNNLIPPEQLVEANSRAVQGLRGELPQAADIDALARSGFFAALRSKAFEDQLVDQFSWGNANAPTIAWYVLNFTLDSVVVRSICSAFGREPYPFEVRDALKQVLSPGSPKRIEFERLAQQEGVPVPSCFD